MDVLSQLYSYTGMPKQEDLDLFEKTFNYFESDKSTRHNYHEVYSSLFSDRGRVKEILEVGVYHGGSLRSWEQLFENARILGLDYDESMLFEDIGRIKTAFVDQRKLHTFYTINFSTRGRDYDFIIDDGCHNPEETLLTFTALLPYLAKDGWFIVEDIRLVDEESWEIVSQSLPSNYKAFLINMNHLRDMENDPHKLKDNIVLAVKRIS